MEPSAVSTRASGKPDVIHCRIRLYMKSRAAPAALAGRQRRVLPLQAAHPALTAQAVVGPEQIVMPLRRRDGYLGGGLGEVQSRHRGRTRPRAPGRVRATVVPPPGRRG